MKWDISFQPSWVSSICFCRRKFLWKDFESLWSGMAVFATIEIEAKTSVSEICQIFFGFSFALLVRPKTDILLITNKLNDILLWTTSTDVRTYSKSSTCAIQCVLLRITRSSLLLFLLSPPAGHKSEMQPVTPPKALT